ncbi:MAG: OmpA/MotB domain protein [Flavipsychrobacter sp.]|nr:OmpA/MotB domain protein [Flavipsychrobacter sp.]
MKLTGLLFHLKCSALLLFLILLSFIGKAQRYIGLATSDRCSINSLYLNPANIADCREKMSIGIFSLNVGVDNNLGHIPKIPDVGTAINESNNIFTKSQGKSFSMLAPAAVFRGPGFTASLSKKISIALTSGVRAINQFNNFDPALYNAFASLQTTTVQPGYSAKAQNFNWTAHMWSEVGLTLSGVVREGDKYKLTLGATVRRLGGIGYVSITGKNLDLNFRKASDTFYAANSDIEFGSNVPNDSSTVFKNLTPGGIFNKFFGQTAGDGIGADIGFTVRYRIGEAERSDYMESTTSHDLVFSAAITDWGAITYYNSTNAVVSITGEGLLTAKGLDSSVKDVASVLAYAQKNGFKAEKVVRARRVYLPTALVTSMDVQVYGRFYANLLFIANLAKRMNFGNSYYNQVTLTPRYDFHKMTIALPITYSMLAHDYKAGFAFRYTGFFIGSDDFLALINKKQYGFDLYIGGYIPIFKRNRDPTGMHWEGY